ncbi:MAG: flippase-like domain-containing protein [Clostridia bacterium]|nr:flippase-like domain-containing protein [Clostridia bacterium]
MDENVEQSRHEIVAASKTENLEQTSLAAEKPFSSSETNKQDTLEGQTDCVQQNKMNEAEQAVSKNKSRKSKMTNLIFFFVNLAVVGGILAYQLTHEKFTPLTGLTFKFPYLFVIGLLLFGVLVMDAVGISYLLKQATGKWKPCLAFKTVQIGRYYDNVTPLATGGQPFQVTYLKGRGVPIHNALSIPLSKYVFSQIAWLLVSLTALIVSNVDKSYGDWVSIMSIIGFILSFFVLFIIFFLSVSKKVGRVLVAKTLKLLHKMKIVKNYDKQYEKITKTIGDYQDVMKQYAKSPKDFLVLVGSTLIKLICNYSIPFFIVKFFVPELGGDMYFKMLIMSVLVDLSASFFPLPGGTGLNEISFSAAFGAIIKPLNLSVSPLVWVLILWRFCSYYFYLLQGVCILTYDMAYGNRKYRWQVVKNNLAEESAFFKQQQINKFKADRAKRRKLKNQS